MFALDQISAVTFDAGGTLMDAWPSVGQVYAETAAAHGLPNLPADLLNRQFAAAWRARIDFDYSEPAWAELVDQTFAGLTARRPSRTFFPALYRRFAEAGAWRVYDDVRPTLTKLAQRGLELGVISNWDGRLRPLLRQLNLQSQFSTIVVSGEVGFQKPAPEIFRRALAGLGLPPDRVLHVGDSRREDVEGARAVGMKAALLDRGRTAEPDQQIASLAELFWPEEDFF